MEKKKWYLSKTVWAALITAGVAIAQYAGVVIPNEIYGVLAALGLYGMRMAKKPI